MENTTHPAPAFRVVRHPDGDPTLCLYHADLRLFDDFINATLLSFGLVYPSPSDKDLMVLERELTGWLEDLIKLGIIEWSASIEKWIPKIWVVERYAAMGKTAPCPHHSPEFKPTMH